MICLQDRGRGLCGQTAETTPIEPGDLVDVIGFTALGDFSPSLEHAIYIGAGLHNPAPVLPVSAKQALTGDFDSQLVSVEGRLIGHDRAAKDPTVLLSAGKFIFSATLPSQSPGLTQEGARPEWEEGSALRVTGICSVESDRHRNIAHAGFSVAKSFRILLRTPDDVVIL